MSRRNRRHHYQTRAAYDAELNKKLRQFLGMDVVLSATPKPAPRGVMAGADAVLVSGITVSGGHRFNLLF